MTYDFAIIGAGIAGASVAAAIAPNSKVLLLEAESQPGYHATGRSASFWHESYGGPDIAPLTSASGAWLEAQGFLDTCGALIVGQEQDAQKLNDFVASYHGTIAFEKADPQRRAPGLHKDWNIGVFEPRCAAIDAAGLHQHYLSAARAAGAVQICKARLEYAKFTDGCWVLQTGQDTYQAKVLVNAAGAWADEVAQMCGAKPLGIAPLRRTIVQLRMREPLPQDMPPIFDVNGSFYFKPIAADRLWMSPQDEIPSPPCDAAPEELDVAIAIARLEEVVDWKIAALEHKWAGLRSFAPDRRPVYGYDRQVPSFFWCAGQGGFGIQTSPAGAALCAALLTGQSPNALAAGLDTTRYAPERFAV